MPKMYLISYCTTLLALLTTTVRASVATGGPPVNATGVTTIVSPSGVTIRYKQPGKDGVCETTPGVNSYSGYVDLDAHTHMFFWFVEARNDVANAPLTLWLNGGPGSDSLIGLFQELGPCNITADLKTQLNPYAWNEVSNMLFLSQPIGVGFSYSTESSTSTGTLSQVDSSASVSTTDMAAIGTWHVLQGFLANLSQLDAKIKIKKFNLWTESYGGHYGPSFYSYFKDQNNAIANRTQEGTQLIMDTLGIGNGLIDAAIQMPYYPEFAVNNTYGIQAVTDDVYQEMKSSYYDPGMCKDQIAACLAADRSSKAGMKTCENATGTCRDEVEGPYYIYSGRGVYDIRHPYDDPTPPTYFVKFLNLASTQQSLGVNLNYTTDSSSIVGNNFATSGDFVFPTFLPELENLLRNDVRVALYYGDADYICNWFGGQAVSLAVNYTHSAQFRAAGYAPFVVDDEEYGEVRQYGNFSFLRIYESGHEVPYYQPKASLEFFRRVLNNKAVADGSTDVCGTCGTNGTAEATHTEALKASGSLPTGTISGTTSTAAGTANSTPTQSSAGCRRISMFWK